jgi:hypothetical protein
MKNYIRKFNLLLGAIVFAMIALALGVAILAIALLASVGKFYHRKPVDTEYPYYVEKS